MEHRIEEIKEYFKNWIIENATHDPDIIEFLKDPKIVLYGDDNNPYVRITGSIAFVTQCIFVQDAFAGPLNENSDNALFTTNEILQTTGTNGPVWALFLGIFTLSVLRSSKVDLLPSWGVNAGYGAAILVIVNGVGSAFGLIPDTANLIILVLGGVVLYPATVWALGVSFQNSGAE